MGCDALRKLRSAIEECCGIAFEADMDYQLEVKLAPVCAAFHVSSLDGLASSIFTNRDLNRAVIDAITINETSFFRDGHPFALICEDLLPPLITSAQVSGGSESIRILSVGCSTGQEAYSLAMMIAETFPGLPPARPTILAIDISSRALGIAKEGLYSQLEVERGLSQEQIDRHLTREGRKWRIGKSLRERIEFREANVLTELDELGLFHIILCRNISIYFSEKVRDGFFERLHNNLAPDGKLIIGSSEILSSRIFTKKSNKNSSVYYEKTQ